MSISPYYLQELKNANGIVEVISGYVRLKRSGSQLVGLCPFHSEKTPSFQVVPGKDMFYCFGCGVGGDVISFIRRIENLDYIEALNLLAQRAGMPAPEAKGQSGIPHGKLMEINRAAAKFYFTQLSQDSGKEGLVYLLKRGLRKETIKRFGLGYAPNDWRGLGKHLTALGYSITEQETAGVVRKNDGNRAYDVFRHRVVFPILDQRGNIIAFGGRAMGQENRGPKYLNTGDTPIFQKNRQAFALNFAKNTKRPYFLLCEGYMDVVSLHQAGFDNAIATLGTSLTVQQAKLLARYTKEVVIAYDSDDAGRRATERASGILREAGLSVRVLDMQGAKDPDEFMQRFGPEKFERLLEAAASDTAYKLQALRRQFDVQQQEGKLAYLEAFAKLMVSLDNPLERDVFVGEEANALGVDKDALQKRIQMLERRQNKNRDKNQLRHFAAVAPPGNPSMHAVDFQRMKYPKYAAAEDKILGILQQHPDCYPRFSQRLTGELFVTDDNRDLLQVLLDALQEGNSVDLSVIGERMTLEQIDRITAAIRKCEEMHVLPDSLPEYIQVLEEFSQRQQSKSAAEMTHKEFDDFIKHLRQTKQKQQV